MTKRNGIRIDKALQALNFPASRAQLVDFATDREAGAETLAALRSIPAGHYANKDEGPPWFVVATGHVCQRRG